MRAAVASPHYLGTRYRSRRGDRLVLWHWTLVTGRRQAAHRDCPQCADGKIEVGHDSSVAECVELSRYLLGKERGPRAADELAVRFTDEVIVHLPCDRNWSIDACTIRDWVDDAGPLVAKWADADDAKATPHRLPPADTPRRSHQIAYPGGVPTVSPVPTLVPSATAAAMTDVLDRIEGEGF